MGDNLLANGQAMEYLLLTETAPNKSNIYVEFSKINIFKYKLSMQIYLLTNFKLNSDLISHNIFWQNT